ncbi:hypothetical protein VQL36_04590 [Chengkuizengella sp. SCS-71B]|uniref:hypothetical protein n=1 Tax=Chengkuizengella sp. SCS-71B TaxID=3115290 RepID=UPI0032C22BE7
MKRLFLYTIAFCIVIISGCSYEQTFEEYFHAKMEGMHEGEEDYSYKLVFKQMNVIHQDDAIAIFREHKSQEDKIFIAYFEKENEKWGWKHTRGSEWNMRVKWSSMLNMPYIYSGTISDDTISEVYAGKYKAKIINVENEKRFWFAISHEKDVRVRYIYDNDTEVFIEEVE